MIEITVTKFAPYNWIANWGGQPTYSAWGTNVLAAAENLLLSYDLVGVEAGIVSVYDGNDIIKYERPIPITISKDRLL